MLTPMNDPHLELFVFDLAGTTVKDDHVVQRAFESTARGVDLPAETEWLRAKMGWSKKRVFEALLELNGREADSAAQLVASFEQHLRDTYANEPIEPTKGAMDAIESLESSGTRVAFTTGFPRSIMDLILGSLGWSDRVSVASDEVEHGRPAPDLIQAAMRKAGVADPARVGAAGDTPSDLEAASAAGCSVVVGLGCGTHTLDELSRAPHTHLALDPSHMLVKLSER